MRDIERILDRAQRGDAKAPEELLPLVYDELRKLAAHKMASEPAGHTLQPTALVHEAWLRLVERPSADYAGRTHFLAAAAEAMRRILIESARRRRALKRGAGITPLDLDEVDVAAKADSQSIADLTEAMKKLAEEDPASAELVKLRFFGGLTHEEAAQVLGVTERTAKRYWRFARAFIYREMRRSDRSGG